MARYRVLDFEEAVSPIIEGETPPSEEIERGAFNVSSRKEHMELLRDENRMMALGLDPLFEKLMYIKRYTTEG